MAKNIVEDIFNSKNNLSELYPNMPNAKNFDMERKHLLYGRIDQDADAIILDGAGRLKQIRAGSKTTEFAVRFVSDAFRKLHNALKEAHHGGITSRVTHYSLGDLRVYKAWRSGDIEYRYNRYLNKLYADFVDNYLSIDGRHTKITSFNEFTEHFIRYILRIAKYFPVTKTGYILSAHCSPFISGLMLEIAQETHGVDSNLNVIKYMNDPNFKFFIREANKYGFMVDKNAPWRLVFNITSGYYSKVNEGRLVGAQKYMDQHAVDYDNVFQVFYTKAHMTDLWNLKTKMASLYDSYYRQFATYEKVDLQPPSCSDQLPLKIQTSRHPRSPRSADDISHNTDEYWLKILLKLRMAETSYSHTIYNFNFFEKEMINLYRLFNEKAALNYINDLTKGFRVTKFIRQGSFWYGTEKDLYETRKRDAVIRAYNPDQVQYSLSGTKNIAK